MDAHRPLLGVVNYWSGANCDALCFTDTQHHFNEREIDWGFTSFMPLSELYDSCKGYLVNDTVIVEADVSVRSSQDSKKETGSVGLKNRKAEQEGHKESSQPPSQENNSKNVVDNAPPGKIRFLSYWVSPEASLVLERIHNRYKGTFAKFSMTSVLVQTVFLESFASFIESMSTTKICEVNKEALCVAVKDFEHVGLDLSWLKQRLDQAKMVNKRSELLASIDSYEKTIEHTRAKLRELKEGLAKAKAEVEVSVRDLPKSLGVNDSFFEEGYAEDFGVVNGHFDVQCRRLVIFPKWNNTTKHLSVYVNVPDSETLSYGWSRSAHFSLALINHLNGDLTVRKGCCYGCLPPKVAGFSLLSIFGHCTEWAECGELIYLLPKMLRKLLHTDQWTSLVSLFIYFSIGGVEVAANCALPIICIRFWAAFQQWQHLAP
ncbi:hypothetical protein ACSBR2_007139 [Camellia fascicularis]